MTTLEILEMVSETAEVWKTPKSSGREQARWQWLHALDLYRRSLQSRRMAIAHRACSLPDDFGVFQTSAVSLTISSISRVVIHRSC